MNKKTRDKLQLRVKLRKQVDEWFPTISKLGLKIHCGLCKKRVNFWSSFRCYYCGLIFCRTCSREHFKTEQNANKKS